MLRQEYGLSDRKNVKELYIEAFPKRERLPFFFLRLFCKTKATFTRYYKDDTLVAFTVTVQKDRSVFLVFFAVDKKERGKGIGSCVLSTLKQQYGDKTLVADIEDPNENCDNKTQRVRRLAFYEKNGLTLSGYALSEYCGTLSLVSSAPLSAPDAEALAQKASFLKWRYRVARNEE